MFSGFLNMTITILKVSAFVLDIFATSINIFGPRKCSCPKNDFNIKKSSLYNCTFLKYDCLCCKCVCFGPRHDSHCTKYVIAVFVLSVVVCVLNMRVFDQNMTRFGKHMCICSKFNNKFNMNE